jgi:hypothetical protein
VWVVYHKATKQIVGLTPNTDLDVDRDGAVNEIVDGLLNKSAVQEYDAILVQEKEKAADYMAVFPDKLILTEGGGGLRVVIREPESFSLHVTCDAKQKHPVDKIPMIPSDGTSFTTITIQKIDERSAPQRGEGHNDTLYLRTDYGTIRDVQGDTELGEIQLKNGRASIRLVSEPIKRVATVQIMSTDPKLPSVDFRVAFS